MILPTCVAHCNKTIPSASVLSSNRLVPASLSLSLFISCRHSATSRLSVSTQVCLPSTIATISTPIRLYCWTSPQSCSTHELPRPLQSPTYNSTPKYLRYPRFSCHGPLTTSCAFSTLCCGGSTEFFFLRVDWLSRRSWGPITLKLQTWRQNLFRESTFFGPQCRT